MGIKGLIKFLREKYPETVEEKSISDYAFQIAAIDVSIYLYKFKSINQHQWFNMFYNFVCFLRRKFIHPLFVFDTGHPEEKSKEKEIRKEKRDKTTLEVCEIRESLNAYLETGEVSECLANFNDKVEKKSKRKILNQSGILNTERLFYELEKKESQAIELTKQDIHRVKELLDVLGVRHVDAVEEAETTCFYLKKNNKVDLVISEDSDLLAYGCEFFISKIDSRINRCVCINYQNVLEHLELTEDQFLDFCILSKTDYNDNMRGIGINKSFSLIKKYQSIEEIEKDPKYDTDVLKYKRVREIFRDFSNDKKYTKFLKMKFYCKDIDEVEVSDYLIKKNLNVDVFTYSFIEPFLPSSSDDEDEE